MYTSIFDLNLHVQCINIHQLLFENMILTFYDCFCSDTLMVAMVIANINQYLEVGNVNLIYVNYALTSNKHKPPSD